MRAKSLKVAVVLSLFCVVSSAAQEHPNVAKGLAGGGGAAAVDSVNPFNGNLVIQLPIGQSYPVSSGLSFQLVLTYNSQVWEYEAYDDRTRAVPARGSNAGLGWSLHLGRLNPPQLDLSNSPTPDYNRNTYLAPDGSAHTFYPTLHEGEAVTPGVEYTRDGSYLRLKTASRQIESPDGTIHTFSALTNGYLTRMEDRFGNFIQADYLDCSASCVAVAPATAHSWRITDLYGRTHWIQLRDTGQPDQPRVITQIDLQAFGGSRAIYKLLYNDSTDDQSTTGTATGLTGCRSGDNYLVWLLTRLVLPDGSAYDLPKASYFAYNVPGDLNTPCKTGLVNRLQLPTLGSIEWDYILYKFPSTSTTRSVWQRSTGVGVRRLYDAASALVGGWTYTTVLSGGTNAHEKLLVNNVVDPLGNQVRRSFSVCVDNCTHPDGPYEYGLPVGRDSGGDGNGRFVSTEILNAAGTPLRTTYVRFEHDTPSVSTLVQERGRLNQRLAGRRVAYNDDSAGTVADEESSNFDGLGHYRQASLSGNFGAGNTASSVTSYNPTRGTYPGGFTMIASWEPWVLGTYSEQTRTEGTSTTRSEYCFDANTGFLLRARALKTGTTRGGNDVAVVFTPSAGNPIREEYYGGDVQSLGTGELCGLGLPANQYRINHAWQYGVRGSSQYVDSAGNPLSFKNLDIDIDLSTGLAQASRDTSGIRTDYEYDPMGRPTWTKPETGHDGWTQYVYSRSLGAASPAQVQILRRTNGGGTVLAESIVKHDSFGRVWQEQTKMPNNSWSIRETQYNAVGWMSFVTEQGNTSKKTQFQNYDAFGRPGKILSPDGGQVTFAYSGVRQVSRTSRVGNSASGGTINQVLATTQELYDRQGRLFQVKEQAEADATNTITTYSYDVGNRLSRVNQATSAGTQNRWFTYDNRGFLASEQHPEKGPSGNGAVSYSSYDALGHARGKVDGQHNFSFTYDRAERMTQVTGNGGQVLKTFTYGTSNALGTRTNGRLESASRYNYVGAPFNATVLLTETYTYGGRQGRVSRRNTQMTFNGTPKESFVQTWSWNPLGDPASLGYPECTFSYCAPVPRAVNFVYTNGFLTSVPNWANAVSYHPNGLVNQITHFNGVVDTQNNDPNMMRRPSSLSSTFSTATLWASGAYAYDESGNVTKTGNGYFLYDRVSRLIEGRVYDGPTGAGTQKWQSYTYDPFGNIKSIGGTSGRSTPTDSLTNRQNGTGTTYDAAGNLIVWAVNNNYEYDGFNQMIRMKSGSEDWVYIYTAGDERFWSYRADGGKSLWALRDLDGRVLREYEAHISWGTFKDYIYRGTQLLASEGTAASFTDVPPSHPYAAEIEAMKMSGVTAGCGGGQYCPDSYVTRAQMAIFLLAAKAISPPSCTTPIFNDVPCSYWAAPWINELYRQGITAGCGGGSYCPETTITRAEVAVFVLREQYPGYTPPSCVAGQEAFPVDMPASHWGCAFVEDISRRGIDIGCGIGAFCPNTLVTRATMAPFLSRTFSLPYPDMGYTRHYHLDHLGSPRLITSNAASKLAYHVYYPFGEEATAFNQDTAKLKFTGHERDLANLAGSGDDLDYMHARHYSPLTERFMSTDRVTGGVRRPQRWNRYSYVLGNPLSLVDPRGLDPDVPIVCVGTFCVGSIDVVASSSGPLTGIFGNPADSPLRGFPDVGQRVRSRFSIGASAVESYCRSIQTQAPPGVDLENNVRFVEMFSGPSALSGPSAAGLVAILSQPKGVWDFKSHYGNGNEYENFGNFHFGVMSAAAGMPGELTLWGAGAVHSDPASAKGSIWGTAPYGDDPKDQAWIKNGRTWYLLCR
jgi:RHS repeat-associated protein